MNTTVMAKKSDIDRKWFLVDAKEKVLGRLSTRIARILQGKNKTLYTPHVDCGDYVVVINTSGLKFTGRKMDQKIYTRYSGYPAGLKKTSLKDMMDKNCEEVLRLAVKRMLPKNKLGSQMLKRLKIYAGSEHKHSAQKLEGIEL